MILRLDQVACARGGRLLFANLDLTLGRGDAGVVTGPNGAGKSSLLRLCAGLLRPFEGRIETGSRALLGEQCALDGERALAAALAFWATLDGTRDRVEPALAAVDLLPLADVPVRLLSTGQRRRAGLARVVASGAALWLLDEPANGLDTASIARLEALVADHRAAGGAVLVATHLPLALPGGATIALGGAA
ncbi:heme ABC exporter ATP-binding protein CcmA [Sphingomonas rubra]|uniref:Heme exporter protein A n=1 Tax=Sphingomonas rubra TaxID=634430 RepID=A0A1I5UL28_9SPHN|nr:heme ABC exporter ATP-binding protein CcmA [Sphingomonas rubra]SFP95948.1 heme exporter protein A [Sphingomonas rubra]